jgi:hypothetical protein
VRMQWGYILPHDSLVNGACLVLVCGGGVLNLAWCNTKSEMRVKYQRVIQKMCATGISTRTKTAHGGYWRVT